METKDTNFVDEILNNLSTARELVEKSVKLLEDNNESLQLILRLKETRKNILLTEVQTDCTLIPDPERLISWLVDLI